MKIFTRYRAQYKESFLLFDNLYGSNENKIFIDVIKKVVIYIIHKKIQPLSPVVQKALYLRWGNFQYGAIFENAPKYFTGKSTVLRVSPPEIKRFLDYLWPWPDFFLRIMDTLWVLTLSKKYKKPQGKKYIKKISKNFLRTVIEVMLNIFLANVW